MDEVLQINHLQNVQIAEEEIAKSLKNTKRPGIIKIMKEHIQKT